MRDPILGLYFGASVIVFIAVSIWISLVYVPSWDLGDARRSSLTRIAKSEMRCDDSRSDDLGLEPPLHPRLDSLAG